MGVVAAETDGGVSEGSAKDAELCAEGEGEGVADVRRDRLPAVPRAAGELCDALGEELLEHPRLRLPPSLSIYRCQSAVHRQNGPAGSSNGKFA